MVYHWQSQNVKRSGVDDMVLLSKISDETIVENLKKRYMDDYIFTCIGPVLVSVNPFKQLDYFGQKEIEMYQGAASYENPPHIFGLTDEMFRNLLVDRENQCVIISGESGSGKTVAARYVMSFIACISGGGSQVQHIKDVVLESNPLLEAFGNAKTVRNNNSSRFGKYVEMQFGTGGQPTGGSISNFLLEKSRVIKHNANERSFHIFYQLCKAATEQMRRDYFLGQPSYFQYLNFGKSDVPQIDDVSDLQQTLKAMTIVGFTPLEKSDVFKLTSAVLHLGNVNFHCKNQYAAIKDSDDTLTYTSHLLSIRLESLTEKLISRKFDGKWAGKAEQVDVTLNVEQAIFGRDALAKALYAKLFDFLVKRTNNAMLSKDTNLKIGILDIYGFEIFETNGFEQFCINYVNEKLQQIFIELTLKAEQEEYIAEKIQWTPIDYFNNQVVCELLESRRPPGVFSLLDDICVTYHAGGETGDQDLLKTLKQSIRHEHLECLPGCFAIHHYAGRVIYTVDGFCEKNRDVLFSDLVQLMQSSTSPFIRDLFKEDTNNAKTRPTTAGTKIRNQAKNLVEALTKCTPHYVRCIKPNESKRPRDWEEDRVRHQVEYLGLKENVRVRRAGFAYRRPFGKFLQRYGILTNETRHIWKGNPKEGVQYVLSQMKVTKDQYQLGSSKIFIKAPETVFFLEDLRDRRYNAYARVIQGAFKKYFAKRRFESHKENASKLLLGKKQRRACSLNRNFMGDYVNVESKPMLKALINRNEKVLFAETVTKFDRNFKSSLRDLILTSNHLYLIGRKKVRKGKTKSAYEEIIKRKIALDDLSLSLSSLQDSYVVLHVRESYDTFLEVPLKTEFVYLAAHQYMSKFRKTFPLKFSNAISFKVKKEGWGGGGLREINFSMGAPGTVESVVANRKVFNIIVPPGLPADSRPNRGNKVFKETKVNKSYRKSNNKSSSNNNNNNINNQSQSYFENEHKLPNFQLPQFPAQVNLRMKTSDNAAKKTYMNIPNSGAAGAKRASLNQDIPVPKPRPPIKPKPTSLPKVKAVYEYTARDLDELSFSPGDIISLTREHEGGWWQGVLRGKEGLFPSNYVEKI